MNTSLLETTDIVIPDLSVQDKPRIVKLTPPYNLRLNVQAGRSTRLLLIIDDAADNGGAGESHLETEVRLASGACVKMLHLRRGGVGQRRTARNRFYLGAHADLDYFSFTGEGALTLSDNVAVFEAEHAFASFKGLAVLRGTSVVQDRIIADHAAGHGVSRQFYKNILAGSASSQFDSLVAVKPDAVKSDSRQLNKNLLLSAEARAEARPELRIDNDDVSCAHGAAIGRIDASEVFYLRSRGLSEPQARYVLTLGFAEEMLAEIEPDSLKDQIRVLVKSRIEEALK